MFIEENFESFCIQRLNDGANPSSDYYDAEIEKIKEKETIGAMDIDFDNFADFAQIAPAVIIGFTPENDAEENIETKGTSQAMTFTFRVFLLVSGFKSRNDAFEISRPILRSLRNLFRGLRYGKEDGATDGAGRLYYATQSLVGAKDGVALILQEYQYRTLDRNTSSRAL